MRIFVLLFFVLFHKVSSASGPMKLVLATPIPVSPQKDTVYKFRDKIEYQWRRDLSAEKYDAYVYNRRLKKIAFRNDSLDPDRICDANVCRLKINLHLPLTESTGHVFRVRAINSKGKSEFSHTKFFIKGTRDEVTLLSLAASKVINIEEWKNKTTDDSVTGYFNWPALEGLCSLYKATGQIKHIENSLELAFKYIDSGVKRSSRYYEWPSSWLEGKYGHGHTEWRAAAGIATLLHTIYLDPLLISQYQNEYEKLLVFLERDIWDKTELTNLMEYNDMLNKGKKVSQVTHFIARVGLVAIPLYQITKKEKYHNWITQNVKIMKDVFFKNPLFPFNCYTNGYNCLPNRKTIDTSHAGDTIAFIHLAYQNSFFFNRQDMENLAKYVLNTLWNHDSEKIKFYDYLDGQDQISVSMGVNQGAWSILGTYNSNLRSLYIKWLNQENRVTGRLRLHAIGNIALSIYGDTQ